jgi:hypothetical protein
VVCLLWTGWLYISGFLFFGDQWAWHGLMSNPLGGIILGLLALLLPVLLVATYRHLKCFR